MTVKAVTTLEELDALDSDAIVAGYRAAQDYVPDFTRTDKAYWHGFQNGLADKNPATITPEMRRLAALEFCRSMQRGG